MLAKANDTYLNLNGYGGLPDRGVDPCKAGAESALHTYLGGNTVYAPGGDVGVSYCGKHDGKSWLAQGLDKVSRRQTDAVIRQISSDQTDQL